MTTAKLEWRSEKGYGMAKDDAGEMIFVPASLAQKCNEGDTVLIKKRKGSAGHVAEELFPMASNLPDPNH